MNRAALLPWFTVLFVLVGLVAAACSSASTPTPTPAPPTPTPFPTATPTPLPLPTPTPLPTATPTPLPPPSLNEAIGIVESAMVRMSRGNVNWTGVMIESSGLILTTARNLGPAPVADFLTAEGLSGEAWVVGRDDTNDVALLRVITPTGGIYATVALALTGAPQIDDELAALSFLAVPGAVLDKRLARVSGVREDPNTGIRYFQIQAVPQAGAEGGAVVDNTASLRGLRMTQAQMVEMGMSQHGEVYAMAVDALVNIVVPQLQAGLQNILPEASTEVNGEPGAPPDLPAVYSGSVSVGGAVPDSSLRVYAKVSKAGKPDIWFSQPLISATSYIMPLPIAIPGYDSATVEFWFDVRKANQVTTYLPGIITEVDLTFPAN